MCHAVNSANTSLNSPFIEAEANTFHPAFPGSYLEPADTQFFDKVC